ncbi:MAG: carboxymuconolactone decarboxylase family protein [Pirellulales bacterium]|nr:carboxymuconolactone decarboxylase family protein [Pirellulales bacterium]
MSTSHLFSVPARADVSESNRAIFDKLQSGLGMVPNLYATFAHSPTALGDYLALQNRKSSLSGKEREVINLVVSQVNACEYCLAAHTILGKKAGFTDAQVLEIRRGVVTFDARLQTLAAFVKEVAEQRGKPAESQTRALLEAGYTRENVIDIIITIGDKVITNYLHGVTRVPVDFPPAPPLSR